MKAVMVVALVFTIEGKLDESKSIYFETINACRYYAQQYGKEQEFWEPCVCKCRLEWISDKELAQLKKDNQRRE